MKKVFGVLLAVCTLMYMFPTSVAMMKDRKNTGAIAILNLVTGWTLVGWFASLIWAATEGKK